MNSARRLRAMLSEPGILELPGAHDAISAQLAERMGFGAIYLSGSAIAGATFGVPDIGLMSVPELIEAASRVIDVVDVPVVCDLDDGGGTPIHVRRMVRLAERAGIAALHIEDIDCSRGKHLYQVACRNANGEPHMDFSKERLRPIGAAVQNIKAAVEARRDQDTVIIARTDAVAARGVSEAIDRAAAFIEAGADVAFLSFLEFKEVARAADGIKAPLLAAATDASADEIRQAEADGLKAIVYPVATYAAAVWAANEALAALRNRAGAGSAERPSTSKALGLAADVLDWAGWTARAERQR